MIARSRFLVLFLALAATPALAGSSHDGTWKVRTATKHGECRSNYDFKVSVKNGRVAYAGYFPVRATGGIAKDGAVHMRVSHGGNHVNANGHAHAGRAAGHWTSPKPHCSGSWSARRA